MIHRRNAQGAAVGKARLLVILPDPKCASRVQQ